MNEHRTCTCPASKSESFQIATDHYGRNFIPTGWKLEYTSLEQHEPQRFLYGRLRNLPTSKLCRNTHSNNLRRICD